MKPFGKCAAFLLIASISAVGTQTLVSAAEDNPGTYYSNFLNPPTTQSETQSANTDTRIRSVEDYQAENDAIGVPKSRVEQSPSLRYNGTVVGIHDSDRIDLEDAATADDDDDEAYMANATTNSRIYDPNNTDPNLREGDAVTLNATSSPENETENTEDGKETAVTTSQNPDTGRAGGVASLIAATALFVGAIPVLNSKRK